VSYDLAILGNDEPALETALLAAKQGLRVVSVLPRQRHSAWFLAQALRRLSLELTVSLSRPQRKHLKLNTSPTLLRRLLAKAIATEHADQTSELQQAGVEVLTGEASFLSRGWIRVSRNSGQPDALLPARATLIAVGVRRTLLAQSLRLRGISGPEQLFQAPTLPNAVRIVGGGDFGSALAALCSVCGIDTELLQRHGDSSNSLEIALHHGTKLVNTLDQRLNPNHITSTISLPSETSHPTPAQPLTTLDCRRAVGFTGHLRLDTLGIQPDENGLLWCSSSLETWCSDVFGAGEIVGFSPESFQNASQQARRILSATRAQRHLHTPTRTVPAPHHNTSQIHSSTTETGA
jgi:pyruvate/2-oxoglutarate dehydrogenase complex dihydrolipoamide dehydrogenase (E3) component